MEWDEGGRGEVVSFCKDLGVTSGKEFVEMFTVGERLSGRLTGVSIEEEEGGLPIVRVWVYRVERRSLVRGVSTIDERLRVCYRWYVI